MVETLKKWIRKKHKNQDQRYHHERFQADFWSNPHNQWLKEDRYIERNLRDLFNLMDQRALNYFQRHPLVFVPSTGELSCALSGIAGIDVIICFPDLLRMLRSGAPRRGQAIVAHEIGHLISRHSERALDRLQAQIEADQYAIQLGLGIELQEILMQFEEPDCRVRITYITSAMTDELARLHQADVRAKAAFH